MSIRRRADLAALAVAILFLLGLFVAAFLLVTTDLALD